MGWEMLLLITSGIATALVVALIYGHRRWQSTSQTMRAELDAARLPFELKTYLPEELDDLPAPVQRYLRNVLPNGQRLIAAVHLDQAGTFNLGEDAEQWNAFTANQSIILRRPGFDWDARITMGPGISVRVHDAYIRGKGILHASLFGLMTLAEMRGTPEAAQGEFVRFFAETAWYPTALVPSQGVEWEAIDDTSARATLRDGENVVTLLFRFGEEGLIESVRAEARGRAVGDEVIPTPWEGRWFQYERRDGLLIPLEGEVSWILPEGPKPYWRGRITDIRFEFVED